MTQPSSSIGAQSKMAGKTVRRLAILSLAGILACVASVGALELPGRVQQLGGGSSLELRGVTYGTIHDFVDGTLFQRALIVTLDPEERWRVPLGGFHGDYETATPTPLLWFRLRGPRKPDLLPVIIDEHGCRLANNRYGDSSSYSEPRNSWGLNPRDYPRSVWSALISSASARARWITEVETLPRTRSASLTFGLISSTDGRTVAQFPFSARDRGQTKTWTGLPCPLVTHSGSTEFILKSVEYPVLRQFGPDHAAATFSYRENGRVVDTWRPAELTVFDSLGNSIRTWVMDANTRKHLTFETLCRYEPVWKLHVRFVRTNPAEAPSDFTWTVRDVAVPRKDQVIYPHASHREGGITLKLHYLHGSGNYTWDSGSGYSAAPGFEVQAEGQACQVALREIRDQRGRRWSARDSPEGIDGIIDGDAGADLNLPSCEGARRVSLTFAVHRLRDVDFYVRP